MPRSKRHSATCQRSWEQKIETIRDVPVPV